MWISKNLETTEGTDLSAELDTSLVWTNDQLPLRSIELNDIENDVNSLLTYATITHTILSPPSSQIVVVTEFQ